MAWYEFQITLSSDEENIMERFLEVVHGRPVRVTASSLYVSSRDQRPGKPKMFYLETSDDIFVPLIDEFFGYPCEAPDLASLNPIAGAARKES